MYINLKKEIVYMHKKRNSIQPTLQSNFRGMKQTHKLKERKGKIGWLRNEGNEVNMHESKEENNGV